MLGPPSIVFLMHVIDLTVGWCWSHKMDVMCKQDVCYWTIDTRQAEFITQLWWTSCTWWIQVGWGVLIIIRIWMMIIAGIHRSCIEKIRIETHCKPWLSYSGNEMDRIKWKWSIEFVNSPSLLYTWYLRIGSITNLFVLILL